MQLEITEEVLQDIINIETGLLAPLEGFMVEDDFKSVVDKNSLADGQVFTVPVTLGVSKEIFENEKLGGYLELFYMQEHVADIQVESKFIISERDIEKVFKTLDTVHPGVAMEKSKGDYRIGGKTNLVKKSLLDTALRPFETKRIFRGKGWKTVVGFQTRNPIHKAHEYIQRYGLEVCDGLFINPLTGWKKKGDFTQEAVVAAYETMIREYYPPERVYMAELKTQMRYAGPREAVFHAIIRRNLGCTHFLIGRDHAGVGNYYGAYDAHALARDLTAQYDLGIELLLTREPYYCTKCKQIVTDKTCSHYYSHRIEISGTIVRKYISERKIPDEIMLREDILTSILSCDKIFIE